ncbi:MAG: hypothetical protein WBB45_00615 [Cyclobacteriaceae bacterium]
MKKTKIELTELSVHSFLTSEKLEIRGGTDNFSSRTSWCEVDPNTIYSYGCTDGLVSVDPNHCPTEEHEDAS